MGKIALLREDVYRKIAAGEIIEKPLSVVKELMENSIDSGASQIKVELSEGGKKRIKISDNGSGIDPEDILLAFSRHATSKLCELSDFNRLSTLGFRGEALASILDVARIELETSNNLDGKGWRYCFENSVPASKTEIAGPRGTSIVVSDLFYNFPVRKKFLKSDKSEYTQIADFLEHAVLAFPGIAFSFFHNDRKIWDFEKVNSLKDRIYQVFGRDILEDLESIDYQDGNYSVTGFLSRLNTGSTSKKMQYIFVNNRSIREKTILAALNNTCRKFLAKDKFPVAVLLFAIPPQDIDVNIHPMKLEIKFRDNQIIYQFVNHAIKNLFSATDSRKSAFSGVKQWPVIPDLPKEKQFPSSQAELFPQFFQETSQSYSVLGQFNRSYIIAEENCTLYIVDQHNAHERILFEKLKKASEARQIVSVSPLFPVVIELTHLESEMLEDLTRQFLQQVGFELELIGKNSFNVKKYPQMLPETGVKDFLLSLIKSDAGGAKTQEAILAQIACKSAIKINHPLSISEMQKIVGDLWKTENPYFCPHGRPTLKNFSLDDIEKMVKRK